MQNEPLVSIVTPSYNMAAFLPETIESVLSQDYPHIEYTVMDGGSTDGTLDILKRYEKRLHYVSARDGGAADAINRGCRISRGPIFAWLNADDIYLPGAVSAAVREILAAPSAPAVYGNAYWVDVKGRIIRPYPTAPFDRDRFGVECYICQPAAFMRKSAFEEVEMLDASLQSAFDYDLWIRLSRLGRFVHSEQHWAASRMHGTSKTLGNRSEMYTECFGVLRRHYGYVPFVWVHSRCCYLLDKRDQFFEPLRPSFFKYLLSLPYGFWHNPRQLRRFAGEWLSVMKVEGLLRRFRDSRLGRTFCDSGAAARGTPGQKSEGSEACMHLPQGRRDPTRRG